MQEKQHQKKVERLAVELNKSGLIKLQKNEIGSAFEYLKQAQRILQSEIQVNQNSKQILKYQAVTFNNLAIYYKKTNKPKSALTYLKKAIEIETYKLENWQQAASTHLNICATYSYIGKHQQAIEHANLALDMTIKKQQSPESSSQKKKESKILIFANYNIAIEHEHLKQYQQALESFKVTKELAKKYSVKNMEQSCQQSIDRMEKIISNNRKKILELLMKKKQSEEKGNYSSMRRNKKNIHTNNENQVKGGSNKYKLYEEKRQIESTDKLQKLKISRKNNFESQGMIKKKSRVDTTSRNI